MKKLAILALFACMLLVVGATSANAFRSLNMVFVPASEKGMDNEFKSLMDIVAQLTGLVKKTPKA